MTIQRRTVLAISAATLAVVTGNARAETTLRVFIGNQQRPEVIRPLLDRYQAQAPGVKVEIEVGGATSDAQQQYLTTVLTAKDSAIDAMLIDVIRPAQYAATGWAEPLDDYLGGDKDALLGQYLPIYAENNVVDGKLVSLPAFADAMFLYYRKDLLEKHGVQPPTTWEDLATAGKKIVDAEGDPNLQGVSFQGKAIEGTVCTFLMPYWSTGAEFTDAEGGLSLDEDAALKSLNMWKGMVDTGAAKKNIAEVATDDTRKEFQAGNAAFAVLWAYGWNRFQKDADSQVKDKVGVTALPAFAGGKPASCIGGWQWAVSAFSEQKEEAVKLIRFLSGPEGVKHLALEASNLPVLPAMFDDPEVLAANPWFKEARAAVDSAQARPKTARYAEVSENVRTNVNGVLAGVKTPEEAVEDMESRLRRILR